jgi:hypothetical protein
MWAKPSLRFLSSERRAVYHLRMYEEELLRSLQSRHVDYVVVDSFAQNTQLYVRSMVGKYPDHFSLVYQNELSKVYKVIDPVSETQSLPNENGAGRDHQSQECHRGPCGGSPHGQMSVTDS